MSKVNFTKVEKAFDRAAEVKFIKNLCDLAELASIDPSQLSENPNPKQFELSVKSLQKELKNLKKNDPNLYKKLNLSPQEEEHWLAPIPCFTQEIAVQLNALKERLQTLKIALNDPKNEEAALEQHISEERREHVNKRFNIRKGWLPLK